MKKTLFTLIGIFLFIAIKSVSANIITVDGNLSLQDGSAIPLVTVELHRETGELLASTNANQFGNFSFPNIDDLGGTLDAYIVAKTDSDVAEIGSTFAGQIFGVYNYQSSTKFNLNPSNNFFQETVSGNQNMTDAFTLQKYIFQPYKYFQTIHDHTAPQIDVKYPSKEDGSTGLYPGLLGNHHIEIQNHTFVEDTRAIRHEFGHYIMLETYNLNDYPSCSGIRIFGAGETTCPEIAFKEGWAHAVYVIHNKTDDMKNYTVDNVIRNYESENWGHGTGYNELGTGYLNEYEVAGILWDIADAPNSSDLFPNVDDDHIYNRDDMLWEILNEEPQNILEFYNDWVNKKDYVEYKNLQNELYDSYFQNNIIRGPSNNPISNDWSYFLHDPRRSGMTTLRGDLYHDQGTMFRGNLGQTINNTLDKIGIADMNQDGTQDLILTTGLNLTQGRVYRVTYNRTFNSGNLQVQTPLKLLRTTSRGFVGSPTLADVRSSIFSTYNGKEIIFSTDDDIVHVISSSKNNSQAWQFNASAVAGHRVRTGETGAVDADNDGDLDVVFSTRDVSNNGPDQAYLFIINGNSGSVIQQIDIGPIGTTGAVSIADIRGDERPEIVVPSLDRVRVYQFTGSSYTLWTDWTTPGVVNGVLIADTDNDGTYELIWATSSDNRCPSGYSCQNRIFVRNGQTGALLQEVTSSNYILVQPIGFYFNANSALSLITVEKDEIENTDTPHGRLKKYTFTPGVSNYAVSGTYPASGSMALSFATPVAANIDNQGSYEIVYGKGGGQVIIILNTLSGLLRTYNLGGVIASAPAVGDWDNDGYAEIAVKQQSTSSDSDPPELIDPTMFPEYNFTPSQADSPGEASLIYIDNINLQPYLAPVADKTGYTNTLYSVTSTILDPNNDELIVNYGFPFNSSGQFLPNSSQAGTYEVFVSVSDGNLTDSQSFILKVFSNDTQFENNLSNGLSTNQMNLTANVPQTVFLKIPKDANIQHAEITVEGLAS